MNIYEYDPKTKRKTIAAFEDNNFCYKISNVMFLFYEELSTKNRIFVAK